METIDLRLVLTPTQRTAWQTIRPVMKGYLSKIMRLYRQATPEQRAILRARNPLLDAILDMVGE